MMAAARRISLRPACRQPDTRAPPTRYATPRIAGFDSPRSSVVVSGRAWPDPMTGWIDTAWPIIGAISLTLGLICLLIWARQPARVGYLLFFITAACVAVFSIFELRMMRAAAPDEYATTLRWAHVPVFVLFVSATGFVLLYLRAGRLWLGALACGLRAVSLALNFSTGVNLNFSQVTAMQPVHIWGGESIFVPIGTVNPFLIAGQLSNLLFIVFVADACVSLWRRGGADARRRGLLIGASMVIFPLLASVLAALLSTGLMRMPTALSVIFLVVILAMAYDLGWDVIAAAEVGTRLRESEERLGQSEQRLQLAASAAGLGLWEWNVISDDVWMTRECRSLFGYRTDEPLSLRRFLDVIHVEDREAVERAVRAALLAGGRDLEQDFRIVLPDGCVRWVRSRGRVEGDTACAVLRMRGVSQDLTAHKQAEAEAARQREALTHMSRVSMLGELSGALAHELNQPLSAILSNAQAAQRFLAREPAELDRVREILADIVSSDKRAGAVITRLRALVRKEEAQHQPVNMNELVHEVLSLVSSDVLSRQIALRTELAPRLPGVLGDRVQLQQVLLNLVMNASDAVSATDAREGVLLRSEPTENGHVRVSVADGGRGIPPHDLERIFEPFVTTKPQGMGLGLVVCRTIVKAHGGRLWAANRPEGGAILHLELPALLS
jgi:two-component system, LuxR family, sensor kinase FixL